MITPFLRIFKMKRGGSSFEVLHALLPAEVISKIAAVTPDRRQLFAACAEHMEISELELMSRIGSLLGLPVLESIPASSLPLSQSATLSDMRRYAYIRVASVDGGVQFVCIDPSQRRYTAARFASDSPALAPWPLISQAIDSAERQSLEAKSKICPAVPQKADELPRSVVRFLVQTTSSYGAVTLTLHLGNAARYTFQGSDGRIGTAPLNKLIVGALRAFLEENCGRVSELDEHRNERLNLYVERLPRDQYEISWQSESAKNVLALPRSMSPQNLAPVRQTILIVEDNDAFAGVLKCFLGRAGYEVVHAADGPEALDVLKNVRPVLVVCDLHLPHIRGEELVKRIREEHSPEQLPIIMLSSDDSPDSEVTLIHAGADLFLGKGRDPRILAAHLERLLSSRNLRREAA